MRRLLASALVVVGGVFLPLPAHADHDYDDGYYDEEPRCQYGRCDYRDEGEGNRKERNCVGFVNFCNIQVPEDLVRDLFGGGGNRDGGREGEGEEQPPPER